ncbi:MAG: Fic family protein [Bifidobacterium sp.]|nr:Fic family protein [Bifidobacterium sp.]
MKYNDIATEFHASSTTQQPVEFAEQEYQRRLQLPSTFSTDIVLDGRHKVFAVLFQESIILIDNILRQETHVEQTWNELPGIAKDAYMQGLLTEELLSTNQMEGIRSTRQEVTTALQSVKDPASHTRFSEFAKLYTAIYTDKSRHLPKTLDDIRSIYDKVVDGELADEDEPDGKLFRTGYVGVHDTTTGREIHRGLSGEENIQAALTQMLAFMSQGDMPSLLKAIICHDVFENIHPFYDGNGRTGRFLLALQLREYLSAPTALSLSPVIAENKLEYYKSLEGAQKKINCSETSFFVCRMLRFIQTAQHQLDENLSEKNSALQIAYDKENQYIQTEKLDITSDRILYMLIQQRLFQSGKPTLTRAEISRTLGIGMSKTGNRLNNLERRELISTVGKRPIYYELSDKACELFGIA